MDSPDPGQRTEAELRETQTLLRLLIRHSPIYSYIKEVTPTESRIIEASDNFKTLVGVAGQGLVGKSMSELFPAEFAAKISAEDWNVVSQGEELVTDEVLAGRTFTTFKRPITVGSRTLLFGHSIDITDRTKAESARIEYIHFLEGLGKVDQAIKQHADVEQMLWATVQTVFEIFGCDRAWLLYPADPDSPTMRVPVEVARPEYPGAMTLNVDVPMSPGMAGDLREALRSSEPVVYVAGTERPVTTPPEFGVLSQMYIPVYPKVGKPWVFGLHQCSHARVWTSAERKLFNEIGRRVADGLTSVLSLRESRQKEERFRATFEQAAVGLAHLDAEGRWVRVNDRLCAALGFTRDELVRKTFREITHPEDLAASVENFQALVAGKVSTYVAEKRYLRKDGSPIWVHLTVSMANPVAGEPRYLIAVIQDIEARKQAEAEKARLESQLQQAQKMESIGRLAGGVAHDFNNMLGVILGSAELALAIAEPNPELHAHLEEIRKAGQRSAKLTRQLLAFARRQTVTPIVLDLNETVAGMLKMLQRLIGENIALDWRPGPVGWHVRVDPSQIDQILANLVVNGRDAIDDQGAITIATAEVAFDAELCARRPGYLPGEYVQLSVSDTGRGMDREAQAHLFEPFFTTKPVGQGTGLGLATVYGIVKQNKGFIVVDTELGQGTTFNVHLPRDVAGAAHEIAPSVAEPAARGKGVILLVEDEPGILRITATMLEKAGYTVLPALTPGEAMRLARECRSEIDLLITDVILPEMNGRELARSVQALHPRIQRLFMSGYTADVVAHHGVIDAGVNFIQKPFLMTELAAKVREALLRR